MTNAAQDRLLDLESAIEELKAQVRLWSSDMNGSSRRHRELARERIRALRNRQGILANEIAHRAAGPHSRLAAVAQELDDLWAAFSHMETD